MKKEVDISLKEKYNRSESYKDYEQVETALKIIKDVCIMGHCKDTCPLGSHDGECKILKTTPADWEIAEQKVKRILY